MMFHNIEKSWRHKMRGRGEEILCSFVCVCVCVTRGQEEISGDTLPGSLGE